MEQLSNGYVELINQNASETEICNFLDKHLGVQHESIPVKVYGSIIRYGDVGVDSKTGKVLGYFGDKGYDGPQCNPNRYCAVLTCATWQCQEHP